MEYTQMHNPPHPGRILRQMYVEPLGWSVTELSLQLGVSRNTASQLLNCHARITAQMAWRLAKLWGTSAQYWAGMQEEFDLWQAKDQVDLSRIHTVVFHDDRA